jgi:hypothetical protein
MKETRRVPIDLVQIFPQVHQSTCQIAWDLQLSLDKESKLGMGRKIGQCSVNNGTIPYTFRLNLVTQFSLTLNMIVRLGCRISKRVNIHGGIHNWGTTFGCLTEKDFF